MGSTGKLLAQSIASSLCKISTGLEGRLQNQAATTESPPQHPAEEPDEYSQAESSSSQALPPVVRFQYQSSKLQEEENERHEVDNFEGGAPVVDREEDTDAAPGAGCQRKVADPAPPADPLNLQKCRMA